MNEPLRPGELKQLIRRVLERGVISDKSSYVDTRAKTRDLSKIDIENVLRAGRVAEGEWEKGRWRYRVFTNKLVVIIQVEDENRISLVTTWRENS